MKRATFKFLLLVFAVAAFALACRTASVFEAESTATRPRATRAALRPTFTPIPPPTETPVPTDTPVPTETPEPTAEPSETPIPTRRPTQPPPPPPTQPPPTNVPTPEPSPTRVFDWILDGGQSCEQGGGSESSVTGKITANGNAARGQKVQASSGPGGEPISENPAESNKDGNFKVTFVCGGNACNGDFYVWIVNNERQQVSPFVKFHFDGSCRKGVQNFKKR